MGANKKTDYSLALCNHCKCLWHVECIKPSEYGGALLAADKKVLKQKKNGDMSAELSGTFICPRCCWLGKRFEVDYLRNTANWGKAQALAQNALTCEYCGWETKGGTGAMNRHWSKCRDKIKHKCAYCSFESDDKYSRNRHQKEHCPKRPRCLTSPAVVTIIQDATTVTVHNAAPIPALVAPSAAPASG